MAGSDAAAALAGVVEDAVEDGADDVVAGVVEDAVDDVVDDSVDDRLAAAAAAGPPPPPQAGIVPTTPRKAVNSTARPKLGFNLLYRGNVRNTYKKLFYTGNQILP